MIVALFARIVLCIAVPIDSPLCTCGAEEEASEQVLCECEAVATLRHTFLLSFFWDAEDVEV